MRTIRLTPAQFSHLDPHWRTAIDAPVLVTRTLPGFKSIIPCQHALRVELTDDPALAGADLYDIGVEQRAGCLGW